MISYFIFALYIYNTVRLCTLKSQFQVLLGQDSSPLKMSPFYVSLSQNSTKCLLANRWWNTCFYHCSFFTKKFTISSHHRCLVCIRYFSFVEQTVLVVFPDYSFATTKSPILFFMCLQMVTFTSSMISYFIFLNKFFTTS